ncbi:MAG: LptF/LptG family permease [Fulvivirga sp.]
MKKIDKLIISSFLGPFFLTFLVVVFILLTQHMLKYFDDIVGKDLGIEVLGQLLFYFAVFMTPIAMPLAVLLSSLMTFGNLGEHFELTAIKSAGISLLRALLPIFVFVLGLTVFAYYSNNYFVPKAALEAYSLLYDIKQKKPALDLKEGTFYNGIPDFSIKVDKKFEDGSTLKDVIIYDHRNLSGNKKVTIADSGKMYTFFNDRYLKLELFDGHTYGEDDKTSASGPKKATFYRSSFDKSEFILDLSSFALDRTDKSLFEGNRIMRNLSQLTNDVDSVNRDVLEKKVEIYEQMPVSFYYHLREDSVSMPSELQTFKQELDSIELVQAAIRQREDSIKRVEEKQKNDSIRALQPETPRVKVTQNKDLGINDKKINRQKKKQANEANKLRNKAIAQKNQNKKRPTVTKNLTQKALQEVQSEKLDPDDIKRNRPGRINPRRKVKKDTLTTEELVDSLFHKDVDEKEMQTALNLVRQTKSKVQSFNSRIDRLIYNKNVYDIQWHKILANSVACIIMFLIGAPLGAIIKRGGLGIPVLVSILFFIVYYVLTMTGEKYAKQDLIEPVYAIWSANFVLLPIGLIFLRQARNDARIFEADFYKVLLDKLKRWVNSRKNANKETE